MTIKGIAKLANVSIGTVDRVLHKRGRVSPETEKRVLKIIEESGFKANPFASRLATSLKEYKFAVIIPFFEQDSWYWSLVKSGIDRAVLSLEKYNLEIEYRDSGKGMSENELKKAFDPFFTTKRGKGGSGLGLSIVYNLVTSLFGGEIKLKSKPAEGVEFFIKIPIKSKGESDD